MLTRSEMNTLKAILATYENHIIWFIDIPGVEFVVVPWGKLAVRLS